MLIGKLADRTADSLSRRVIHLIGRHAGKFKTVTADNGMEVHSYERVERSTGVTFYFARPYHSWERGSNENANGLLRQYPPKGGSMAGLTQRQCNAIARTLVTVSAASGVDAASPVCITPSVVTVSVVLLVAGIGCGEATPVCISPAKADVASTSASRSAATALR